MTDNKKNNQYSDATDSRASDLDREGSESEQVRAEVLPQEVGDTSTNDAINAMSPPDTTEVEYVQLLPGVSLNISDQQTGTQGEFASVLPVHGPPEFTGVGLSVPSTDQVQGAD
jgi:hypothetical protein